jgi:hypothetical protein
VSQSRRRLKITIGVIAGVVVLAAGVTTAVLLTRAQTGEPAVRAYFERLAAGDAAGALTYVLPPSTGSYDDQPLLSDHAIEDPDARPAGFEILSRRQTTLPDGAIRDRINVTYTVDGTKYLHTVLARRQERGQPFLLEEPFFRLSVTGDDPRGYSINGVRIARDVSMVFAFPGNYIGRVEGNQLLAEAIVEATPTDIGQLPPTFRIAFETEFAPGAEEAVQAAVNAHLDRCTQDHTMVPATVNPGGRPTPCPFHLVGDDVVSVDWSIARYPDITLEIAPYLRAYILTEVDGLVRMTSPRAGWTTSSSSASTAWRLPVMGPSAWRRTTDPAR